MDTNWKQAERRLAKLFGTQRRPLSGANHGTGFNDDALHPILHIESKYLTRSAVWSLYLRTKAKATKEKRVPVIGIFQPKRHGILLVVHSDDLPTVIKEWAKANGYTLLPKKRRRP